LELASDFAKASKAASTQAAYSSDFRIFDAWCRERGLTALPAMPATVCAFLAAQASLGKRASTLARRLAAIGYFHRLANEPSPVGDETIKASYPVFDVQLAPRRSARKQPRATSC
jgi:site-specific recombinase XerD